VRAFSFNGKPKATAEKVVRHLEMPPACPVVCYVRRYPRGPPKKLNATGLPGGSLRYSLSFHWLPAVNVRLHRASRWHLNRSQPSCVATNVMIPWASQGHSTAFSAVSEGVGAGECELREHRRLRLAVKRLSGCGRGLRWVITCVHRAGIFPVGRNAIPPDGSTGGMPFRPTVVTAEGRVGIRSVRLRKLLLGRA
jgi:hypothetical protein